jgi:NAD(P)-dependent dehydrogenase (short-subunit alcohol dehydrogenase family)
MHSTQTFPELDAPVVLVLGATGGIGSALCRRLAAQGAQLVIGARDEYRLNELAEEIGATAIGVDATRTEQMDRFFAHALELRGHVDGVASCVGSLYLKPAYLTAGDEWASVLACNLTTAFTTVRSAARAMMRSGGSVVLVSSVAARVGLHNHEVIAAAKAGVIGLALSAAATYARNNIRFNCVAPGLVRTPMTASLTSHEGMLKESIAMHPLGRIGEPEDIASAMAWLLDPQQSWITGQVIEIDGGMASLRSRQVCNGHEARKERTYASTATASTV